MRDEENSCKFLKVYGFIRMEHDRQLEEKAKEAEKERLEKEKDTKKEEPKPYHDESEVLADELGLNKDNGGEPDISDMGSGQTGANRW
jgi:hypothetical protein